MIRHLTPNVELEEDIRRLKGPGGRLLELLCGLPTTRRRARYLIPVQAFVDESGDGRLFVMAGFVAPAEAWFQFNEAWDTALQNPDPAAVEYLSTREAMRLAGQFNGWEADDRDRRTDGLADCAAKHADFRIRVAIPQKHYKAVFAGKLHRELDTPYLMAFFRIMSEMARYQREHGLSEPVNFIFDQRKSATEARRVRRGWEGYKKFAPDFVRHLIGTEPVFEDDKKVLPLQAADLLAWHERMALRSVRLHARAHVHSTWDILKAVPAIEWEWTKTKMQEFLDRVISYGRETGQEWRYRR